jgi:hypothetical protein
MFHCKDLRRNFSVSFQGNLFGAIGPASREGDEEHVFDPLR